jgi:hypothetical protein
MKDENFGGYSFDKATFIFILPPSSFILSTREPLRRLGHL